MNKKIGFIGLGKMGSLMVENLLSKKYEIVVYNRSTEQIKKLEKKGAIGSYSFRELAEELPKRKIIFLMVTAGKAVDEVIDNLIKFLSRGDVIIDGGNSYYEDSVKRYNKLKKIGVNFLDVGVSGGLAGARNGACLMIGGDKKIFEELKFLFMDLSVEDGYGYLGGSGAGHFAKIIHNGIEYALLESYGEGFEVLKKSKYNFDLKEISKIWSNGSIIMSYMTELAENSFQKNGNKLRGFYGKIGGGETGEWALKISRKEKTDFKNLENALEKRKISLKKQSFSTKFISALRKEFGGHEEAK